MHTLSRRSFLRVGTGASRARRRRSRSGGRRLAQNASAMLSFNSFVPAADDELRRQAEASANRPASRSASIRLVVAAPRQARRRGTDAGRPRYRPDLVRGPVSLRGLLVDVGDVVDKLGKQHGGWYSFAAESCQTASGWRSVPWHWNSFPANYNMAHFKNASLEYPADLGRAPEAWEGPQSAGQPRGHRDQPLERCQHHVHVRALVLWRQGARGRRQDAGDQLREDRASHRMVQGALQGRDGARGAVVGRRLQQSLPALRQRLLDPQSDQRVRRRRHEQAADRGRHRLSSEPRGARRARTRRRRS